MRGTALDWCQSVELYVAAELRENEQTSLPTVVYTGGNGGAHYKGTALTATNGDQPKNFYMHIHVHVHM